VLFSLHGGVARFGVGNDVVNRNPGSSTLPPTAEPVRVARCRRAT
jgi:hypothetical protein